MIADPAAAPPRTDLAFLRRRHRPNERTPVPRPTPSGGRIDYVHPAKAAPAQTDTHLDYEHPRRSPVPAASSSLDLSASAPARAASSSLDLTPSAPAAPPAQRAPAASSSLDLSTSEPVPPTPALRAPAPSRRSRAVRVAGEVQHLLTRAAPTVTLTRVQSGVGHLDVEAVVGGDVGDLRLAAAYQLRSGGSSLVALSLGRRFGPPSSRRPVVVAGREDDFDRIVVDLRQIRDVERIAIVAFSEAGRALTWGGTLVVGTLGGARIELPLESLHPGATAMLMSLYNVAGELVIRAEMETVAGDVREAVRAYGYDRITWRDGRTPVD